MIALTLASCSRPPATTIAISSSTTTNAPGATVHETIDFPDAVAIRVVKGADGSIWAVWADGSDLFVAEIDAATGSAGSPLAVTGPEGVINHPLERPAMAINAAGEMFVAWITAAGSVRLANLVDGEIVSSAVISGEVRNETALVQMIITGEGERVISWLEDSTLSVAAGEPLVEHEMVDDLTCDCCHPVPVQVGDEIGIGYRDLEHRSDGVVRDITFINGSIAGELFTAPVEVADEPWFLDACPLSGPTLALGTDGLYISWMDARQSIHPDQSSSSIWFDSSGDRGRTFGTDIRLTSDEATYRTPAMAVDPRETIHLVWERRTPEEATLEYTTSTNGGKSFAETRALVQGDEESGVPREAAIVVGGEQMLVSWADGEGGHVGLWPLD